jgi:hypothetical protein
MTDRNPFISQVAPSTSMNDSNKKTSEIPDETARASRALLIVVGGVGGLDWCGIALRHVVRTAGLPYAIEQFLWGHGFLRWHADLTNVANQNVQARSLAARIGKFKSEHPGAPVFVVAKSGGCGIAIKALESLEKGSIERAVLLAPALSPTYDLTAALGAVRRDMVVFWSPLDVVILGLGTRLFGTTDRVRVRSAGLVGFQPPAALAHDADRNGVYKKLRQIRWRPRMAATGYFGGHLGPDSPLFLAKYVVPLLRFDEAEVT